METNEHRSNAGIAVLWTSVAAFAAMSFVLVRGDETIYQGTNSDDIGPFDGLSGLAAVVLGILFGLVPFIVAIVQSVLARSLGGASTRSALSVALYTAACGAATAGYWLIGARQTAQDRRVDATALQQGELLMASTALIGLVPLVVHLVVRRLRPPGQLPPLPSDRRSGTSSSPR